MNKTTLLGVLLLTVILSACAIVPERLKPYRMESRQGALVTPEMVAQLRIGMTRQEVLQVMGSPAIAGIFHANRWDYVYRFKPTIGSMESHNVTLFFENEKLSGIKGDVKAGAAKYDASRVQVIDLTTTGTKK